MKLPRWFSSRRSHLPHNAESRPRYVLAPTRPQLLLSDAAILHARAPLALRVVLCVHIHDCAVFDSHAAL